jgi:hypothetical protein
MTKEQKNKLELIMETSISAVSVIEPCLQRFILLSVGEIDPTEKNEDEIRYELIWLFYNSSCVDNILMLCGDESEWEEWDIAIQEHLDYWRSL